LKNFFRRLVCFVNDPRYGLFYSPGPEAYKRVWEAVVGDSLTRPFSVGDPKPGIRPFFTTSYRELDPDLEWPDFLGNGLFVIFSTWVLWRAFVSPAGLWIALLVFAVVAVTVARLSFQLCRVVWRTWSSRRNRC